MKIVFYVFSLAQRNCLCREILSLTCAFKNNQKIDPGDYIYIFICKSLVNSLFTLSPIFSRHHLRHYSLRKKSSSRTSMSLSIQKETLKS